MSFFEIFNPGERHMREEKDRQKMLVSKPTHGGGAPLGIDLDTGTAKITIRSTSSAPETEDTETEDTVNEDTHDGAAAEAISPNPGTTG